MTEEKKEYKKVEQLLPEGRFVLEVRPQNVWSKEKGEYIEDSIMSGSGEWGNWYIFKTKIGEEWVSMFAGDKNKEGFETGFILAEVKAKVRKEKKEWVEIYGADGKKVLTTKYTALSPAELEIAKSKAEKGEKMEEVKPKEEEEDINIEEINF